MEERRKRGFTNNEIGPNTEESDDDDDDDSSEEGHSEMDEALRAAVEQSLNDGGRCENGVDDTCPRHWYLYRGRPPHVSQMAWSALTPAARTLHLRWLQDLRAMPARLLGMNLASAAIELVREMAVKRRWKWATVAKSLAAISGALRDLPLYSNQTRGIELMRYPEWRAAMKAAQRFERESTASPPAPVTVTEFVRARSELLRRHPMAALFLTLMWRFAARAGDISSLLCADVATTAPDANPDERNLFEVSLAMRRGKGARFRRSSYTVASTLRRTDVSLLRQLIGYRRPSQRLFNRSLANECRDAIRAALRRQNRNTALPSVRKGAVRFLAAKGMSTEELMAITGHTRIETLRRYLGFGPPTPRAEAGTTAASAEEEDETEPASDDDRARPERNFWGRGHRRQ
ncbi:uncharacterized protein Tco025E_08323 [Trypanosoma conorhini]|uniref:TATE DNA Transposon n=1 Tax=Trypanosoma conorhini TaxID=83891 RepID=A0A3R7MI63_9TRYP|nr:uncharacterized protein Tco025E_08323 [Trypanosoma conorhini]RNF02939.1 hypothetical protein Tco025E_08323 [Trypanosoma conorhini]